MFELRMVPVYLALCALALAVWAAFAPGSALASTLGWTLAGMVSLYAAATVIDRANRLPRSVAHVLEEATQVNSARVAAPHVTASGDIDDPRR